MLSPWWRDSVVTFLKVWDLEHFAFLASAIMIIPRISPIQPSTLIGKYNMWTSFLAKRCLIQSIEAFSLWGFFDIQIGYWDIQCVKSAERCALR